MRISDWSSDVCSSDLHGGDHREQHDLRLRSRPPLPVAAAHLHRPVPGRAIARPHALGRPPDTAPGVAVWAEALMEGGRTTGTQRLDRSTSWPLGGERHMTALSTSIILLTYSRDDETDETVARTEQLISHSTSVEVYQVDKKEKGETAWRE